MTGGWDHAVIPSADFMILGLATVHENGLSSARQGLLEGRGFSPAAKPLTHHFVVPPLPLAGEGPGEGIAGDGGAEAPPFRRHFHGSEESRSAVGRIEEEGIRARFLSVG